MLSGGEVKTVAVTVGARPLLISRIPLGMVHDPRAWQANPFQTAMDMRTHLFYRQVIESLGRENAELRQRQQEYERFVQSIWGQEGRAVQRNVELTRPIIEKINEVLARIGEEEDYDIIFDAANGSIAYGRASLDMTERVLEELNKETE